MDTESYAKFKVVKDKKRLIGSDEKTTVRCYSLQTQLLILGPLNLFYFCIVKYNRPKLNYFSVFLKH